MIKERKRCVTCNKPLIAFQGHYLHPDVPCNGLKDMIEIEATIGDEFLNEKFIDLYGEPELSDYERLELYEKILNHPVIKLVLKILRIRGDKNSSSK